MRSAAALLAAALAAAPTGAQEASADRRVIGLVPSGDPAVTAALADGARHALALAGRAAPRLEIAGTPGAWSSSSSAAVELACAPGTLALIAPPDRRIAHAVAQVATRVQLPVLTTSAATSVAATGSYWVLPASSTQDNAWAAGFAAAWRLVVADRRARRESLPLHTALELAGPPAAAAVHGLDWSHGPPRALTGTTFAFDGLARAVGGGAGLGPAPRRSDLDQRPASAALFRQ